MFPKNSKYFLIWKWKILYRYNYKIKKYRYLQQLKINQMATLQTILAPKWANYLGQEDKGTGKR
jgi:hypothetical protein